MPASIISVIDRAEVKRDARDLAGNRLENAFAWTFRTTDAPFEEKWSIRIDAVEVTS